MAEDERLYVVNENDEVVGWASRSECHKRGLIHRSVYMIVLNDRGEVFLQKRSMNKDLYPGLYACSATGHVEYGESYEEAARRELMEELSINAQLKWIGKFRCFSEAEISALYVCHHNGPFNLNSEEIFEGQFVSIAEIKRMLEDGGRDFAYGSVLALKEFIMYINGGGH